MRQWQIDKQQLLLQTMSKPQPCKHEVLIRVEAIGVNRADLLQVKGLYPAPAGYDNAVPGLEYVGIIEALGEQVLQRKQGERVMGLIPSGAYSEYLVVDAAETLQVPQGISIEQAATIPEAFLTAYRALHIEGQLQAGEFCLVRPASSAVGLAAVQLAKAAGAQVLGTSRSIENLAAALAQGLDFPLLENQAFSQSILEITQGRGVDVAFDMLGSHWSSLQEAMALQARLVSIGVLASSKTELNVFTLLLKRLKLIGLTMRSQPIEQRILLAKAFNQHLLPLFEQRRLNPLPYESFAFEQAPTAHQHMQESAFSGKRVLRLKQ